MVDKLLGKTIAEVLKAIPDLGESTIEYGEDDDGRSSLRIKTPKRLRLETDEQGTDEIPPEVLLNSPLIALCSALLGNSADVQMTKDGITLSSAYGRAGNTIGTAKLKIEPRMVDSNEPTVLLEAENGDVKVKGTNILLDGIVDFTNATEILGLPSNSGITELTTQSVRIAELDDGIYKWTYNGEKILYYYGLTNTNISTKFNEGETFVFVYGSRPLADSNQFVKYYRVIGAMFSSSETAISAPSIYSGYSTARNGSSIARAITYIPTTEAMTLLGTQTVTGNKTFTGAVDFTGATVTGLPSSGGSGGSGELTAEAINSALDGQQLQVGGLGIQSNGITFMAGNINEKHDEDMPYIRTDSGMGGYLDIKSDGAYFNNTKLATVNDVGGGGGSSGGGLDLGEADISYDSESQWLNITSPSTVRMHSDAGTTLTVSPDHIYLMSNQDYGSVEVTPTRVWLFSEHSETGCISDIILEDGNITYSADNSHIFDGIVDFTNAIVKGLTINNGGGGNSKSFTITQNDLTSSGSTFSLTSDCLARLTEFASTIDNEVYFEWTFSSSKAYFAGSYEVGTYNGFHGFHLFSATSASEAKIMSLNLSNGTFSGNTSPLNSILYSGSSLTIIVGAISTGSSSGGSSTTNTDEMPSIRLVSNKIGNKDEPISEENPLTLTVETSGQLQVGDQLQVCKRKLYTYSTDVEGVRTKRYKLRRYAEYVVTEEDIADNRNIFSITIDNKYDIQDMLRSGANGKVYPNYLRIRRTCADNPDNAKMSKLDVFTVYGKYSKGDEATDGSIRIS